MFFLNCSRSLKTQLGCFDNFVGLFPHMKEQIQAHVNTVYTVNKVYCPVATEIDEIMKLEILISPFVPRFLKFGHVVDKMYCPGFIKVLLKQWKIVCM